MAVDSLLILCAAVLVDLLLGDPRWLPHPVVMIGKLITFLETGLRAIFSNERAGGVLLLTITVSATYGIAYAAEKAVSGINVYAGYLLSVLLAWTTIAGRSLHRESGLVAAALIRGDLTGARRALAMIVGRDTEHLEERDIWRGAVETVAENSSDGVIAPLFYLALGGAPLALAYKAVNTLDSMVGYRNERYLYFGWASARFDDLCNFIPARITGLLMVTVAPLSGLSLAEAWRIMRRDGRNHSSPNSGVPEAAAAGALGVQLGGVNRYFGREVVKPTIGDDVQELGQHAWRGAVRLMYGAEGLFVFACLISALVRRYGSI